MGESRFISPMTYLVFLCISTISYQAVGGYWSSVMTTVQKLYHLTSSECAVTSVCGYTAGLLTVFMLVHIGENTHRPRFVGILCLIASLGAAVPLVPHFFLPLPEDENVYDDTDVKVQQLCRDINGTTDSSCNQRIKNEHLFSVSGPIFWVALSSMLCSSHGAVFPVSIVYLDNAIPKRSLVLYSAILIAFNAVGSTAGFFLGGVCLALPLDFPYYAPDAPSISDDEFVGAWWSGYLIISISLSLTSLPFFFFPRELPKVVQDREEAPLIATDDEPEENKEALTFKSFFLEFFASFGRIIRNPISVSLALSAAVSMLANEGFASYAPLYIENMFLLDPSTVSVLLGLTILIGFTAGQLIGAFILHRLHLSNLGNGLFYLISAFIFCVIITSVSFIGCPNTDLATNSLSENSSDGNSTLCFAECLCKENFDPVCGSDGTTHYSACHAGCTSFTTENSIPIYTECSCIPDASQTATAGICSQECTLWISFLGLNFIGALLASAGNNGSFLLLVRTANKKDRALTMSFVNVLMKVMGFIPAPILFAYLIDRACAIHYDTSCYADNQDCILYDRNKLRFNFFGVVTVAEISAFALSCIAVFIVFRHAVRTNQVSLFADKAEVEKIEMDRRNRNEYVQ